MGKRKFDFVKEEKFSPRMFLWTGNSGLELSDNEYYRAFLGFGREAKFEEIRSGFKGDYSTVSGMIHHETQ